MDQPGNLSLTEALSSLRSQLEEAVRRAQGEELTFICKSVEVQLQVTVTTTAKGSVKAGLWNVVTVDGGVDRAKADVHQIKLVLDPKLAGSADPVEVDDEE
ncbi:trypco2 family protein [Nonomuraea sp. NPDC052129]|uniref:trypco2 family protein n=1 Tax=Nonomuraea sp. NPDC052129 TaxID=3154651 RepID=UPI003433A298